MGWFIFGILLLIGACIAYPYFGIATAIITGLITWRVIHTRKIEATKAAALDQLRYRQVAAKTDLLEAEARSAEAVAPHPYHCKFCHQSGMAFGNVCQHCGAPLS